MTSDLKPRTRSKKRANLRLYVVLSFGLAILYFIFFTGGAKAGKGRSGASLSDALDKDKLQSAASAITKGIAGTAKDKIKATAKTTSTEKEASAQDKDTHDLVHELKKQAEGEVPDDIVSDSSSSSSASSLGTTKISGDRESYLTTSHGKENKADVTVKTTEKQTARKKTSKAYDATDSLKSLLDSYDMIIFSKSYCPHSKKAKAVLDHYDIRPKPLVFELDIEEHGTELQEALADVTGRTTVPNIVVNGKSIGGGDEVVALDKNGKLISKIRGLSDRTDITHKARRGQ